MATGQCDAFKRAMAVCCCISEANGTAPVGRSDKIGCKYTECPERYPVSGWWDLADHEGFSMNVLAKRGSRGSSCKGRFPSLVLLSPNFGVDLRLVRYGVRSTTRVWSAVPVYTGETGLRLTLGHELRVNSLRLPASELVAYREFGFHDHHIRDSRT